MKVALYGATGASGSRILTELVYRGHQVTAIVRDPSKFPNPRPGVVVKQDDLSDPKKIAAAINGARGNDQRLCAAPRRCRTDSRCHAAPGGRNQARRELPASRGWRGWAGLTRSLRCNAAATAGSPMQLREGDLVMRSIRSILDPSFRYVPSVATSVASTWRRAGWRPTTDEDRRARLQPTVTLVVDWIGAVDASSGGRRVSVKVSDKSRAQLKRIHGGLEDIRVAVNES